VGILATRIALTTADELTTALSLPGLIEPLQPIELLQPPVSKGGLLQAIGIDDETAQEVRD
jgi:hypothetical protein